MKRVLVLGGGFGGVAAAHRLRQKLSPGDEIIVVDRRDHFMVGFRKTWALVGVSPLEAGRRPLENLKKQGIQVIHEVITAIDPSARAAQVGDRRLEADALIVALGAELAPETMLGFQAHALNVYEPQDIPRAAAALKEFRGGKVVVGIFGVPYKCPPAPYEMAWLVTAFFPARAAQAARAG